MTDIATIDWFGRWGTSVFSENTAIFLLFPQTDDTQGDYRAHSENCYSGPCNLEKLLVGMIFLIKLEK